MKITKLLQTKIMAARSVVFFFFFLIPIYDSLFHLFLTSQYKVPIAKKKKKTNKRMKVHCIHKSKHSKKENQNIQQNDLQYLPPKIFYLFYWHHHRLIKIVCFGGSGENGELPEENWWSRSWFSSRAQKFMGSCFGGRIVVWLLRWQSKTAVETISGFFFLLKRIVFFSRFLRRVQLTW